MARKPSVDPSGKSAVVVSVRFSSDIIEILDVLAKNRSEFIRAATYEKIQNEMIDDGTDS